MLKQNIYNPLLLIYFYFIAITAIHAQIVINELSASNLNQYVDNHSDYEDWIELYNTSGSAVDLTGYYLSDDSLNNTKWKFPSDITIAANGFKRFWASGRNIVETTNYHTNFKLKQTKNKREFVVLSDSSGIRIDYVKLIQKTQLGHSYGRTTNGANTWGIFTSPTPNTGNTTKSYSRYADKPDFRIPAGFYSLPILDTITTSDTNALIRYTTNGTLPTVTSTLYSSPVSISTTTVLKAITFNSDTTVLPSFIEFATYFININHTLPVVSIAGTQLNDLANDVNGALVPNGSFEYFDLNKLRKANTYGQFNKHGQDSWVLSQRSLDFMSRDEMGYNHSIEEKLFSGSTRTNYQKIILRAAGDDNYPADHEPDNAGSAHVRDAFIHNLSDKGGLHLDVRRGAKCIVYLNGQYWGVYDLRENPDDHDFTGYYYGQDKFKIQYIETWGNTWAEYGGTQAITDWNTIKNYALNNNMANAANWQYVYDRIDVTSLTDYVLANMFTVCSDWLNYNTGWWRGLDSTGTHLKWGYILWDNDATFGHYINYTGIPNTSPNAEPCDPEGLPGPWPDLNGHIALLNKIRENPDFNQYYISRQIDLWNTVFGCDNMLAQLDSTVALIDPEMTQQAARWAGTYSEWQTNVQALRNFIVQRCAALTNGFKNCYSLTGPYDLTLNADPIGAGSVKLNSITIDQFPWTGKYFGGIETKLEAFPDSNNQFVNWTAGNHSFNPNDSTVSIKISISVSDTIVAHFKVPPSSVLELTMLTPGVSVYPVVFSDEINIEYDLAAATPVSMKLYSLLGNEIAKINTPAQFSVRGHHTIKISLANTKLVTGMYLLNFNAGEYSKSIKLIYSPQ